MRVLLTNSLWNLQNPSKVLAVTTIQTCHHSTVTHDLIFHAYTNTPLNVLLSDCLVTIKSLLRGNLWWSGVEYSGLMRSFLLASLVSGPAGIKSHRRRWKWNFTISFSSGLWLGHPSTQICSLGRAGCILLSCCKASHQLVFFWDYHVQFSIKSEQNQLKKKSSPAE